MEPPTREDRPAEAGTQVAPFGRGSAGRAIMSTLGGRVARFLRAHPVVCLLLLTPGIPEYLSSSSTLAGVVIAPPLFVIFLALNLGLYGPGVLLVREAIVRWNKGWPTLVLLGTAYAILEEGIALSTLFNPNAPVVGVLGFYGHWMGVSWVWLGGIVVVHVVYSVGLPVLLLGLALPETRGKPLVSRRGLIAAALVLGGDVTALVAITAGALHFWMGTPLLFVALVAIGALAALSFLVPPDLGRSVRKLRGVRLAWLVVLGMVLFPGVFVIQAVGGTLGAAPAFVFVVEVSAFIAWGTTVLVCLGRDPSAHSLLAVAIGLIVPIAATGVLASLAIPIVVAADVAAVLFLRFLWRKHAPAASRAPPMHLPTSV